METTYLSQPVTTTFSKGVAADNITKLTAIQNNISVNSHTSNTQPNFLKTIVDMVGEGLKQNFLGPNIDIEFLSLTVRSVVLTSVKTIRQFVKPLIKKDPVATPCHQLNQPCF